jgi:7-cyano-7-deazaguanine synthase in queuosine biosynthesis
MEDEGAAAPRAVVLLSGGLDSATTLAVARSEGYRPYALSIRYGQRHEGELKAERRVADRLGVERHVVLDLDLRQFGGSALTDDIAVPKGDAARWMRTRSSSASTRWTTAAIPIAAPSSSTPFNAWRTSPPAPAWSIADHR